MRKNLLMNMKRSYLTFFLCTLCFIILGQTLPTCENYGNGIAENIVYSVNGNIVPLLTEGNIHSGDHVSVCFSLSKATSASMTIFSLVTYKAPGASFDSATASLQTVFSMDSKIAFGDSTCCLSVIVPDCYFQLDFVKGCVIYQFWPFDFYGSENRLIASVSGGTGTCNCVATAEAGPDMVLNCNSFRDTLSGSTFTHKPVISWQAIDGGNIVSGSNTLTPVVNAPGIYILTVEDTLNCSVSDSVTVTGHTNVLTPGKIGPNQSHCGPFKPDTIRSINAATANAGDVITYRWLYSLVDTANTYGNLYWHVIPGADSAYYSPDSIFVTTYYIRCAKTVGCTFVGNTTESNIVGIQIFPKVIVDLGRDTSIISCHHDTLRLDAGNKGATYLWNTGAVTQTIDVTTSGVYYVNVTNKEGCSASDTIKVNIVDGTINLDLGPDTTLCGCIVLNAFNPGASYAWCSGQDYPFITVCKTGTYCVQVRNGICIASDTIHIIIDQPPIVNLGNDTTLLSGALVLNAGNAGATFLWSTGDTTQMITVTESGKYSVTVTEKNGCKASDSIVVNIVSGISENSRPGFPIRVFPNPSIDKILNISFDIIEKGPLDLKIIDCIGREMYSEQLENFSGSYNKKISLQNFAAGIYFVNVMSGTVGRTVKISIE